MTKAASGGVAVPPPPAPGDPDAWYAPDVRAQYAVHPGIVATVTAVDSDDAFEYTTREATLAPGGKTAYARIAGHFDSGICRNWKN